MLAFQGGAEGVYQGQQLPTEWGQDGGQDVHASGEGEGEGEVLQKGTACCPALLNQHISTYRYA